MNAISAFLLLLLALTNENNARVDQEMQEKIDQLESSYMDLAVRHSLLAAESRVNDQNTEATIGRIEEKVDFLDQQWILSVDKEDYILQSFS